MSRMTFGAPGTFLSRVLRWGLAPAAVAMALAGCGGGGGSADASSTGAASAQMNGVAAFALAQQSVSATSAPAATAPAAGNLVVNSGFENGTTGWGDWGNSTVVSGQAHSGASALRVGPGAGGVGQVVPGIVPGTTYRLTAQAKVSVTSETAYVGLNFVDAAGNPLTQNSVLVSSTSYTAASVGVAAPPNAVGALVYVWKNAGTGLAVVDDFSLQAVGQAPSGPEIQGNQVVNGGIENGLQGWANWGNTIVTADGPTGNVAKVGPGAGGFGQEVGGILGGHNYRLSAQAKVSVPGEVGYLGIVFIDDAGNWLLAQNVVFGSSTYQRTEANVTAPASATRALVFVWKNAGGGFAFVDEASLVQVAPGSTESTPPSGGPTAVATANTNARGVAALASGLRVAAWSDASGVHSQLIDAQGRLVGGPMAIAPTGTFTGVAALAGGGYAVQYSQPDAVFVQLFDATGAPAGAPVAIRTQAQVTADPRYVLRDQARLVGAAGVYPVPDGGFIAAWRESHMPSNPQDVPIGIFARRYDALGSPMGAPSYIEVDSGQGMTTLAPTPSGGLIVGSLSVCGCGSSGQAVFDVYDNNLQSLGQAPRDSTPGYTVGTPNGAGLANGTFVGVWTLGGMQGELFGPAPSGTGFVDLTPRHVGPPLFTAAMPFANAGKGARVTALAGGGFLLSWGTSAQAFNANGSPASDVVQILEGSIAATPQGGFVVVAQVGSQLLEQEYAGP